MKLYFVIYMLGMVGGNAGPLPYGIDECLRRAAGFQAEATAAIERGTSKDGLPLTEKQREAIASLSFKCEWHDTRPVNDYRIHDK